MEISRFPNKLKFFRRCGGYSQKKVARLLGLSDTSTLSRWENGLAVPGIVHVFRLARMYDTQPHHLFDDLWKLAGEEFSALISGEPQHYSS